MRRGCRAREPRALEVPTCPQRGTIIVSNASRASLLKKEEHSKSSTTVPYLNILAFHNSNSSEISPSSVDKAVALRTLMHHEYATVMQRHELQNSVLRSHCIQNYVQFPNTSTPSLTNGCVLESCKVHGLMNDHELTHELATDTLRAFIVLCQRAAHTRVYHHA